MRILLAAAILAAAGRAEFLSIEVSIRDMNCQPCSASLEQSLQKMRGVEKAEVDFKGATVRIDLADKNRISVEQVWDTVKRVGFTPGETKVHVRGAVKNSMLEVPEIGKLFQLEGHTIEGTSIELRGSITPPENPRTPIVIKLTQ